ncbi:hypothetical protein D7147_24275 [Micromonospora musae]|uniref:Uncharacterized protein n=1 Tax=Micromonospora musae TaxID=1894970 RepID=A0A3A9YMA2_9ACTN|nr:hypothetical protein [Micromonospora musae]RKN16203.1 hypothetical protein D7147_24275 [Micromonospora musae]RKN36184.1 hypothetical protein D7044_00545 [Micromonospora musae]
MTGNVPGRHAVRRRRQLWSGVLALIGLVLLIIGLTIADGVAAWVEVIVAVVLLVVAYLVQAVARRDTVYRRDDGR